MKIEVFTFCWNEISILPFVAPYWRRYATKVTVYDNGSTDGSIEFLQKNYGDLVEVVPYETDGMNNQVMVNMKNDYWRQARGRADLVVVCDIDEILIPNTGALEKMLADGATLCKPQWYDLFSEKTPKPSKQKLLHEQRPLGVWNEGAKVVLFDPNKIDNINYTPGAHRCNPEGEIKWYAGNDILLLHINNSLSLDYRLKRFKERNERRSQMDINNGWGVHYAFSEERIREDWQRMKNAAVNYGSLVNLKVPFLKK